MNNNRIEKLQELANEATKISKMMQDIVKKNMEEVSEPVEEKKLTLTELDDIIDKVVKGEHRDALDPSELISQSRPHYDVELTNATGYLDEDTLYLALRYRVATDVGDVDLLFPKVHLPITTYELPEVFIDERNQFKIRIHDQEFFLCDAPHPDYADMEPSSVFEVMKEPPIREMTVSEIEAELGYKVKVIGGDCCGGCEK